MTDVRIDGRAEVGRGVEGVGGCHDIAGLGDPVGPMVKGGNVEEAGGMIGGKGVATHPYKVVELIS
jgi:hypothetical protein